VQNAIHGGTGIGPGGILRCEGAGWRCHLCPFAPRRRGYFACAARACGSANRRAIR
jgi:hypothetical protein